MNARINKFLIASITAVSLVSCFDKFDPDSYRPVFEIGGFSSVDEIEPTSLVGYWSLDGTLAESISGNSADNAGTTFVNGFKGQAANFNVANKSYFTFDPSASITGLQNFTISFWVNPTFVDSDNSGSIDGVLGFVSLSNPGRFWGNIEWFVENNSNNDAAVVKVILTNKSDQEVDIVVTGFKGLFGNWTNHTLTFDGTTKKLTYYINGSVAATKTITLTAAPLEFTNSGAMVFGAVQFQTNPSIGCCGNQPWASYLTGSMDEVRIYNKALSGDNVNALVVLQGKGK
jgi:Concanavalin A-like lectin/glucanases superfamily